MKTTTFKLALLLGILILSFSCKKDNNTTSNTNNNGPANGSYNASGTISFTAGGINYSCPISKVIVASISLTIQTSTANQSTTGSIIIT
jgi:hypothetical protein